MSPSSQTVITNLFGDRDAPYYTTKWYRGCLYAVVSAEDLLTRYPQAFLKTQGYYYTVWGIHPVPHYLEWTAEQEDALSAVYMLIDTYKAAYD